MATISQLNIDGVMTDLRDDSVALRNINTILTTQGTLNGYYIKCNTKVRIYFELIVTKTLEDWSAVTNINAVPVPSSNRIINFKNSQRSIYIFGANSSTQAGKISINGQGTLPTGTYIIDDWYEL